MKGKLLQQLHLQEEINKEAELDQTVINFINFLNNQVKTIINKILDTWRKCFDFKMLEELPGT